MSPALAVLVIGGAGVGIALVWGLLRWLFPVADGSIEESAARQVLMATLPNVDLKDPYPCENGFLFETETNEVAVVRRHGDRLVSQVLRPGGVRRVTPRAGAVEILTGEYADPLLRLQTSDPAALRQWLAQRLLAREGGPR